MTDQAEPLAVPLRRTPAVFRWWLLACLLAVIASTAALARWAPGPDLTTIFRQPGALTLLALILLADLYPTLPWVRTSKFVDDYILSTPLAIAALLVFGPHAAVVFLVAGAAMTIALRMVWWRVLLNTALWGLQGAAAAAVLALITGSFDWAEPMPSAALVPLTVVLALVIESLNVLLVMTSLRLAGAVTVRGYLADWRSQLAVGALALTAPIPAVLAERQPALLPLLALAMMAAQSGMSAVYSRTAQAGADPLTALGNRATLLAALRARLEQLRRPGDTVTLLMVDLDRFKRINDRFGHPVGDQVLVEIARRLEEGTRSADLVARYGGDEFAILLAPGALPRSAQEIADRIRLIVARPISLPGGAVLVDVSIGSATASDRGVEALDLIKRADDALYRVKNARSAAGSFTPAALVAKLVGGADVGGADIQTVQHPNGPPDDGTQLPIARPAGQDAPSEVAARTNGEALSDVDVTPSVAAPPEAGSSPGPGVQQAADVQPDAGPQPDEHSPWDEPVCSLTRPDVAWLLEQPADETAAPAAAKR